MFRRVIDWLCGFREMTVPRELRSCVFVRLYKNGIGFSQQNCDAVGDVRCRIRLRDAERLQAVLQDSEWSNTMQNDDAERSVSFGEIHGLVTWVRFFLFRPALLLGAVLFAVWTVYSSRLIWDVRIEGNDKTPTSDILALLEELGCGIGDYYPSINFNHLHAEYAARQNDIAWLSVYMNGTVAEVQVRELYKDERPKKEAGVFANLVAASDGVVEEVNVFEGQACVRAGDTVRAGQVLISGVVEHKDGSIRYEYAAGEVICTVAEPISVEIPLEREEKVYTGREKTQNRIKIFKKNVNLFLKGGIVYDTYDKIDTMGQFYPFGLCSVPVYLEKSVYREYTLEKRRVTTENAVSEATLLLNQKIREATAGAELLQRSVRTNTDGGVYRLDCLLYLSRNNASPVEFTARELYEAER